MQKRTEFFIDVLQVLDNMHDICGMVDVMSGLNDFHVKRLRDKNWVIFYYITSILYNQKRMISFQLITVNML